MNQAALTRVWQALSIPLLLYALNAWIADRGLEPIFDLGLVDRRPVNGALIAFFVCAPWLLAVLYVADLYGKRSGGTAWHNRMPVVWLGSIDTAAPEAKLFQATVLVWFTLIPGAALTHFAYRVLADGTVVHKQTLEITGLFSQAGLLSLFTDNYRIGEGMMGALNQGVTFFPLLEPVTMLALLALVIYFLGRYYFRLAGGF